MFLSTTEDRDTPRHGAELRRIHLPKLFGNSEWVPNGGSETGQDGSKESRSADFCCRRSALETPSAIFQTVSPRTPVNKGVRQLHGRACRATPMFRASRSAIKHGPVHLIAQPLVVQHEFSDLT